MKKQQKHGINPVTINPIREGEPRLTIARVHLQLGDGPVMKHVSFAMFEGGEEEPRLTTIDEDVFIDAMGHLFPHAELNDTHLIFRTELVNEDESMRVVQPSVAGEISLGSPMACKLGQGTPRFETGMAKVAVWPCWFGMPPEGMAVSPYIEIMDRGYDQFETDLLGVDGVCRVGQPGQRPWVEIEFDKPGDILTQLPVRVAKLEAVMRDYLERPMEPDPND